MVDPGWVSIMRIALPISLVVTGLLLIVGSIWLTWYFFEYESDNAGALFGMTVMPLSVGIGSILTIIGIVVAVVRFANRKK
ncbi:hypothetical protein [Asticcacaulis taihuensis]|uniref:Uncharacterized protein n=2 Tax=Asticcacaulis taihuensis TaxID=260084 RepID=A0A1G4RGE0_9CAUL|nr:hypothetical protein [Asticcacaulis taihuensis]SCW55269.1 hypothetical protein SAMN02927928_1845 [Asticcacaulis taihuensis]